MGLRLNIILRYIGIVILVNAAFMFISAMIALGYGPDTSFYPLLLSSVLTAALGFFPIIFVGKSESVTMKESYMIVVGAWIIACLVGTFPYLLWGGEFNLSNAWFESVSGFTTTGATCLENIEILPHGLLFWRSSTHWLGGVGVVMFALVILPALGRTKMTLYSVELSPLARDNYKFKAQKIVRILLFLYIGLTACEAVLLKLAGMPWFDAVNHSFSTIATGGFSTKNASIGFYSSFRIEFIVMFFMALSGVHFGLIFATLTGKGNNMFKSEVVRYYFATFMIAGLLIGISLFNGGVYNTLAESFRHAYFQSIAFITTTGFLTADTGVWTSFAVVLLVFLMFQCAGAGSTSGGIKSDRVWLAFKVLRVKILQQQHPSAVVRLKMNNILQDWDVVNFAMFFIVIYIIIVIFGTMIVAATGLDLATSFSLVASSMGNVGPGFGGITTDYAQISPFVKVLSTLFMLLGRLEIFGFIQLFLIKWWR